MTKKVKPLLISFLTALFVLGLVVSPALAQTGGSLTSAESRTVVLINQERKVKGLPALQADPLLVKLARQKAQDMVDKGYFRHTSPTYGSLKDMLLASGVKYTYAGKNLALTYSVDSAYRALIKSPASRENMLSTKYDRAGVGIARRGHYLYIVQLFTGQKERPQPQPQTEPQLQLQPAPQPAPQPQPQPQSGPVNGLTVDEQQMIELVNQERARYGLAPLKVNLDVVKVARLKARDMVENNYFNHTSPTYGSPFDMLRQFGISYRYAGENLAGAPTVGIAHQNLMNSPGHRANILNPNFKEIGIGVVSGSPYGKIFVQMFIG